MGPVRGHANWLVALASIKVIEARTQGAALVWGKTMRRGLIALAVMTAGCTHASVSSVPIEIPGVGTVYRYQGRANFVHQTA